MKYVVLYNTSALVVCVWYMLNNTQMVCVLESLLHCVFNFLKHALFCVCVEKIYAVLQEVVCSYWMRCVWDFLTAARDYYDWPPQLQQQEVWWIYWLQSTALSFKLPDFLVANPFPCLPAWVFLKCLCTDIRNTSVPLQLVKVYYNYKVDLG